MTAPDRAIDAAVRSEVIERSAAALQKSYVFPEVAARIAESVRSRAAANEYDGQASARGFARLLTEHMQAISHDKHLRVLYTPDLRDRAPAFGEHGGASAFFRTRNYGFEKVERIEGNIGYLEIRSFAADGEGVGEIVAAAMTFLARCDALIVDVRRNGGGRPQTVALVSSYLFDRPVHLNNLYWREGDRTDEFWTSARVLGTRFGSTKPVFVLTSARTFSVAEEFAYNLKSLARAKIVGETTGGGANPGGIRSLTDDFSLFVPTGRAINPITRTNWEGTGVVPDVAVPADQALEAARQLALKAIGN